MVSERNRRLRILVSAGEASGDLYASELVGALRGRFPDADFFGCAGHRMQKAGVRTVVDAASLSVVGLVEVVKHIPRIHGEYKKMIAAAERERPDVAILTDSPDFHLRLARRFHKMGIPVVYLVAPQAWAWRKGRVNSLRRNVDRLLCIFPFEEQFFLKHGVRAVYIGHPLSSRVKPSLGKAEFFRKHRLSGDRPLVVALPGSRPGEISRHLPPLTDAVDRLFQKQGATFLLASPPGFSAAHGRSFWEQRLGNSPMRVIEGETWDAMAHADLALAASGTVTVEAALLGTPMVTYYKVTGLSWLLGRLLVRIPFYSMVNLVAERAVVPELMQDELTGERLAAEAERLLRDPAARERMRLELAMVRDRLSGGGDPMMRAADCVEEIVTRV